MSLKCNSYVTVSQKPYIDLCVINSICAVILRRRCRNKCVLFPALECRPEVHVPDIVLFQLIQKHVPENTVVPEHILSFKIGAGTPAVNDHDQLVHAFPAFICNVEFGRIVRTFGIADKLSVYIYVKTAGGAQKAQEETGAKAGFKECTVNADEVVFIFGNGNTGPYSLVRPKPCKGASDLFGRRNYGRLKGELITGIDVKRSVISPELPAGRNVQLFPLYHFCVQFIRNQRGLIVEPEIPVSVQTTDLCGRISFFLQACCIGFFSGRVRNHVGARLLFPELQDIKRSIIALIDLVFQLALLLFLNNFFFLFYHIV